MNNKYKNIVEIKNLFHSYGKFELNIPIFNIEEGTSIGLTGRNGSGKTTLMKILAKIEKIQKGNIKILGKNINSYENNRDVTYLLQEPYLLKKTVFENISYGLKQRNLKDNLNEKVNEALIQTGLNPEKFAKRKWFELSGGEAQRVAIASRLILNPKLILLDEPIANVDIESAEIIKQILIDMRQKFNTTLIVSSHDKLWLNSVTDEIVNIHNGKIIGKSKGNIISGPWKKDIDNLWSANIGNNQKIFATKPPTPNSDGFLQPTDIILSKIKPIELSAQNILTGKIISMKSITESSKLEVQINIGNITINSHLTTHSTKELNIIPGNNIWVIFKATSIEWI